jgi:hypothetical protein
MAFSAAALAIRPRDLIPRCGAHTQQALDTVFVSRTSWWMRRVVVGGMAKRN